VASAPELDTVAAVLVLARADREQDFRDLARMNGVV
jgi:hypothetical protein